MASDKTKKLKIETVREWLTLDRAAKALTPYFEDEVEPIDLLQLALEQKITLSVLLATSEHALRAEATQATEELENEIFGQKSLINGLEIRARKKRNYTKREVEETKYSKPMRLKVQNPITVKAEKYQLLLTLDSTANVSNISGVWDLPILEGSEQEIERLIHRYLFDEDEDEDLTFEELIESNNYSMPIKPIWLVNPDHSEWQQLQEQREEQDRIEEAERYNIPHENPFSIFFIDFDGSLMRKFMTIPEISEDINLLNDSEQKLTVEKILIRASHLEQGFQWKK
jgi:hypothetical protein